MLERAVWRCTGGSGQDRSNGNINAFKGSGFHVEMSNEPRFQDSSYGVTRPIGRVVANDDESSKEEAENKILSKAVGG